MAANTVRTEAGREPCSSGCLSSSCTPNSDRSIRALPRSPVRAVGRRCQRHQEEDHDDEQGNVLVADVQGCCSVPRTRSVRRPPIQLQTWGQRVEMLSPKCAAEQADPAAIAPALSSKGIETGIDAVLIGRLHTKTGLMDELGKVKRVIEKRRRSTGC